MLRVRQAHAVIDDLLLGIDVPDEETLRSIRLRLEELAGDLEELS